MQLFVEERERIALAEVAGEVDVPFQHVDELVDDLVRHAARRREERALDDPVLDRDVPVVVSGHHAGRESVPVAPELHGGDLVHVVVEPGELAVRLAQERDGLSGAKAPQLLPVAVSGEEALEIGLGESDPIEDEVEGVAVADDEALHLARRGGGSASAAAAAATAKVAVVVARRSVSPDAASSVAGGAPVALPGASRSPVAEPPRDPTAVGPVGVGFPDRGR